MLDVNLEEEQDLKLHKELDVKLREEEDVKLQVVVYIKIHAIFFIIKPTRCTNFTIYLVMKLYIFRAVPLSIVRSLFTVHSAMVYVVQLSSRTRMELQCHPGPARNVSTNLYDIYHCSVYSE